jgi:homocysteine S-methyltransferase
VAIRIAMRDLEERLKEMYGRETWWRKKFWTSFVFPGGNTPDGSSVQNIIHTMLDSGFTKDAPSPTPSGIGINCTSPAYISSLSQSFTNVFRNLSSTQQVTFVLYPDGGLVYDPVTKTWSEPSTSGDGGITGDTWAINVASVAREVADATDGKAEGYVWSGVIVGGCCKAGYEEIRGLSEVIKGLR